MIKFVAKKPFCNFLYIVLKFLKAIWIEGLWLTIFLPRSTAFHDWESALIKCFQHLHKMAKHDRECIEYGSSIISLCWSSSSLTEVDDYQSQWLEVEQVEAKIEFFTNVALNEVFSSCDAPAKVRGGALNPDLAGMVRRRGIVLKTDTCIISSFFSLWGGFQLPSVFQWSEVLACVQRGFNLVFPTLNCLFWCIMML